tara:strand:- start:547 stop:885 length:339 start_codon:yes stop_codon:yes gene_type:complete
MSNNTKSNKKSNNNGFGYGRTLTKLFNFTPTSEIPPATFNGGLYTGEKCVGEHCPIPVRPTVSNYINNNLKSKVPGAEFSYPGTDRLGNNMMGQLPGIGKYNKYYNINGINK